MKTRVTARIAALVTVLNGVLCNFVFGQELLVCSPNYVGGTSYVNRFDAITGSFIAHLSALPAPNDLAIGPDGLLYVSCQDGNVGGVGSIHRFDPATWSYLGVFVPAGSGGLRTPHAIAFGPDGNLYVTHAPQYRSNGGIKKFDGISGAYLGDFVPPGTGDMAFPIGMAFGPDGNLYVSCVESNPVTLGGIKKFHGSTGAYLGDFVAQTSIRYVMKIVFAGDGSLWATGYEVLGIGAIAQYDGSSGAMLNEYFMPPGTIPNGIAFGPGGHLYVSNAHGGAKVTEIDPANGAIVRVLVPSSSAGMIDGHGILFTSTPNGPPIANAGPDISQHCQTAVTTSVALDGSGSTDPENDDLTYTWTGAFPEGGGTTIGVNPTVTLPIGSHLVSLTVSDGEFADVDTVLVTVTMDVEGFFSPLATLVPTGHPTTPKPNHAFKRGRTVPLKLRLLCGTTVLTNDDVAPPEIDSITRDGNAVALNTIDPDAGQSNDCGLLFRFSDGQWIYNLSTAWADTGSYVIVIKMPDGTTYKSGFELK